MTRTDMLDGLEEALDILQQLADAGGDIDKIEDLMERIRRAREEPSALDENLYADILCDLLMLIPGGSLIPEPLKKLLGAILKLIGEMFEWFQRLMLDELRNDHRDLTKGKGGDDEAALEAAKTLSPVRQHYLWLFAKWKEEQAKLEDKEGPGDDEEKPEEPKEPGGSDGFTPAGKLPSVVRLTDVQSFIEFLLNLLKEIKEARRRLKEEDLTDARRQRLEDWLEFLYKVLDTAAGVEGG